MKRLIVLTLVITQLCSCAWVFSTPSGIREIGKAANGMVVTGKATPDVEDAYHKNERLRITFTGGDNGGTQ